MEFGKLKTFKTKQLNYNANITKKNEQKNDKSKKICNVDNTGSAKI